MNTKLILAASAVLLTTGTVASLSVAQQAQADSGKDRSVTVERVLENAERMFTRIDSDSDGVLSQAEVDAIPSRGMRGQADADEEMADAGEKAGRGGKLKDKVKGKGRDKGKRKAPRVVKAFLGENGFVYGMTWDDVQAQITASFNDLDTDNSGTLTRSELRPALEALRDA
ncbi:MAG: hypothetical protein CBC49_000440 [Alphaproteobacteria bacterium TMED89]|nr:hypothetical protein [Rhodospirillaceae bacterium]RPH20267.1 MAG: hypothetical protein CBC49_000440 [Alphaproteobacteria bacterium TMED89]